jgi:two-component system, cell cycle response regulator CpdR
MASILLAEDDDSLRVFLANALGRAGHLVTSCGDGDEALAALETRGYDLLLADIVMPGIDGIELAQRATEHLPSMKVLFITGFAAVALNAQKSGANRNAKILSKPFHLRDLVSEVDKILNAAA